VRFSLIIVTKDRPVSLAAVLESSAQALPADGEVIVVDGDPERSAEPVVQELQARYPEVSVRHVASDPGAARQRNVGIDAADGDVVVYVDDDCTFEPGLFEALASAYADPAVLGATGRVEQPLRGRLGNDPHSRLRWLLLGGGRQGSMSPFGFRRPIVDVEQPRDVEFMPGPLMSARRVLAAEVRFDERLVAYSLVEDDDFSYRVSRRGRIRYEPDAVVHHHELRWRERDQRQMDRLQVANRTYLFRKNFTQTFRARAGFAALLVMLCGHRVLNREWSGLRGLIEGMIHARRTGCQPLKQPLEGSALERPLEGPAISAEVPAPVS
jgi:glycosyltransferase involved in cell wall biosynthesis